MVYPIELLCMVYDLGTTLVQSGETGLKEMVGLLHVYEHGFGTMYNARIRPKSFSE